jgi:ABC-type transport system substrate-binding protein/DNA-binding SARP family transcriptional activator
VIDYRLLGTIEAAVNGRVLDLGGLKQRALLAVLVLNANEPVTREALVDKLWGERPPADARHTLDVYISRLRKTLEADTAHRTLLTRPNGYVLTAHADRIDVRRFERLAAQGRRELAAGEPGQAAETLSAALGLWRGTPLADFSLERFARPEVARLEEIRAGVLEDRIEADLALGRHADVVSELATLIDAHPLRERLARLRMIALYRCGRQQEALDAYQATRRVLLDELGIEPGPELRRTERAILEQDPSLDPPRPAVPIREPDAEAAGPHRQASRAVGVRSLIAAGIGLALVFALVAAVIAGTRAHGGPGQAGPDTVGVIDASQNSLTAVVTSVGTPGGAAQGYGFTWISDTADNMVLQVSPAWQVIDRIPVGPGPAAVAVGAGEIWVANTLNGTVSEVNPRPGILVKTIRVGNGPDAISFAFGSVWVANVTDNTITRIDPRGGRPVTIALAGAPAGLAPGRAGVWVVTSADRLLLVDPRTNRISRSWPVGVEPAGVAAGSGDVWVAGRPGTVARVNPSTGQVQDIRIGGAVGGIAYARGAVWVADGARGAVARIDPATGSTQLIQVGNQPTAVTAAGPDILATVLPSAAAHFGGMLTVIAQLPPSDQTSDPAIAYFPAEWQLLSVTNDGLVTYQRTGGPADNTLVPDLATALPSPTDGGLTYTFRLRPGIRYSTGVPVRPDDFRRAIERLFAVNKNGATGFYSGIVGASACARAPSRCDLAAAIVADDKAGTVTFHLVAPDPDFLYKLAFSFADAIPPGTPFRPIDAARLPATGPYLTQSYVPDHRWVLVRNPRFRQWSALAQPRGYPDRIVLRLDVSAGRAVTAVEHSSADVLLFPTTRIGELATRYPSLLHVGPQAGLVGLALNTRVYPFTVRSARQAFNDAVDRNTLTQMLGGPRVVRPTCQFLPPGLPGYEPYCPYTLNPGPGGVWTAPDLARAEELVRASGTRGAKVTLVAGSFGTAIPTMPTGRYLVSVLDKLGYRASLRVLSYNDYIRQTGDSRWRTQVSWFSWYPDYPAPSDMISPVLSCTSFVPANQFNLNTAEFCDPGIDAQATQALALQARAPNAAEALWARIDQELVNQAPWVPVFNPQYLVVTSSRVGNYQFDPRLSVLIDQLWVR